MIKRGRPKKNNCLNTKMGARVTKEEYELYNDFAKSRKMSISDLVRKAVDKYVSDDFEIMKY